MLIVAAAALAASCTGPPRAANTPTADSSRLNAELGTASPRASIDPNFDFGQFVLITDAGPVPKQLVCAVNVPITWVNRTGSPVTVTFDRSAVRSEPIAPGGTWQFVPHTTAAIVYHAGATEAGRGAIAPQPTVEP